METAGDAVDAVPVERFANRGEVVGRQLLRVVELVIVDQVPETPHSRPPLFDRRDPAQLWLVSAGVEPRGHPAERPDSETRLHAPTLSLPRPAKSMLARLCCEART